MKGEGDSSTSPTRKSILSSRPSSRSPMQELNKNSAHHRSSQAIHTNGKDCNGTTRHSTTKTLKDTQQRAVSSELGDLTAPGETKTKSQMARAFQESQELYKTADSKAGLQTIKTKRILKKTTTITRGENEKVSHLFQFYKSLNPCIFSTFLNPLLEFRPILIQFERSAFSSAINFPP